jgi:hypothetical protein
MFFAFLWKQSALQSTSVETQFFSVVKLTESGVHGSRKAFV